VVTQARGETVIIGRTVRSGGHVESSGSVVVLGDVNAGAEIMANDDIIVLGTLRGVAHAGVGGNEKAVVWAQRILAPQLRIGNALAQAGESEGRTAGPEVAHLRDGQIVLRPWS
jgi:septum site-determining protein MinC